MNYFFEYNDFRCDIGEDIAKELESLRLAHVDIGSSGTPPERFGNYTETGWLAMTAGNPYYEPPEEEEAE